MRKNRAWWMAVGVAGVILTAACGGGDAVRSGAGVARTATSRKAASRTAAEEKPAATVPSSTTVVPAPATPTSVKPKPAAVTPTTVKPAVTPTTKPAVTPTTAGTGVKTGTAGQWFGIANVTVTEPDPVDEPPGTACDSIAFSTGVKGDVYVEELPCAEALSFLREHAWSWGATTGPDHVDADGFSCDIVSVSTLPQSTYECTRGTQAIWWVAT